jgi:hypothetical protein
MSGAAAGLLKMPPRLLLNFVNTDGGGFAALFLGLLRWSHMAIRTLSCLTDLCIRAKFLMQCVMSSPH